MNDLYNYPLIIKKYIIYEDKEIIVINKPEGLLTIPDGFRPNLPNLRDLLISKFGSIWVVHRLDKQTSGVLIFAKNKNAHKMLNTQFQNREIKKSYFALVYGFPHWNEMMIDYPIRMNGDRHHRTIIDVQGGKKALSKVEIIKKFNTYSYVQIYPESGYSHQIRCHLAAIGLPINGDHLYGLKTMRIKFQLRPLKMVCFYMPQQLVAIYRRTDKNILLLPFQKNSCGIHLFPENILILIIY